ncbi:hypothetical protein KAR91_82350 [Candidatus Pacearchaeota archaeon]|nr:hypothetical protein [Candidatus Pacearchaeota archaeon]
MSNEQSAAAGVSEDLQTSSEGSQPSTDKASASPEEKKAYALEKRFGKLTGDKKKVEAEAAKEREARKAAESKAAELEDKLASITAPKAPDPDLEFNDPGEFERQSNAFKAHEKSQIESSAIQKAKAEIKQEMEADEAIEKLNQQEEEFNRQAADHITKGQAVGLTEEDLVVSASLLNQAGTPQDVQSFLFQDEQGPQIMDYLSNNPKELDAMLELAPIAQTAYIERNIRAKAVSTKPTVSGAPPPLLNISGGGMKEESDINKLCPGAVFK